MHTDVVTPWSWKMCCFVLIRIPILMGKVFCFQERLSRTWSNSIVKLGLMFSTAAGEQSLLS